MTAMGNRQRSSYVKLMGWLSNCHEKINVLYTIEKSFTTFGLCKLENESDSFMFVHGLNHKLKKILFVNNNQYDQAMKLFFLLSNSLNYNELIERIDSFIDIY